MLDAWVDWFDADLLDYFRLKEALDGIDMVFHCAAMVSFHPSDRQEMFKINIDGTEKLGQCLSRKRCKKDLSCKLDSCVRA